MIDFLVKYSQLIALIFFFTAFCVVLVMVFRPKTKKKYKDYANIPLKDDEDNK